MAAETGYNMDHMSLGKRRTTLNDHPVFANKRDTDTYKSIRRAGEINQ
ncbi:MAG: hypothetical protein KAT85_05140 [candidate division Zixibacteria bacterium]|nr:hypothetical protein [candidate division Zixibacteria bacterium]